MFAVSDPFTFDFPNHDLSVSTIGLRPTLTNLQFIEGIDMTANNLATIYDFDTHFILLQQRAYMYA
jgi:hypothetical protein